MLSPILFVDDNADLAAACQISLVEHGFDVATAHSGDEAISLCLQEFPASVAIVDLKMPGMDGPQTIAALRECQPALKIIAVSAQSLQPYFGRLSDLGVRIFLPKPFSMAALLLTVEELQAA